MSIVKQYLKFASRFAWVITVTVFLQPASGTRLVDQTFPVLKTRTGTYTNVTVTTRADTYIFIVHARGMTSIRVKDLSPEAQQDLGYAVATPPPPSGLGALTSVLAKPSGRVAKDLSPQLKQLQAWQQKLAAKMPNLRITSEMIYTFLAVVLLIYFSICYCLSLICSKAGSPGGLLVWIPIFQIIPLLRAAGMSGWWFVPWFIPGLNLVPMVLWSLNMAKVRGKSVLLAICLILPVTAPFALLYLAFSNDAPPEVPVKKFQTRALEVPA